MSLAFSMNKQHLNISLVIKPEFTDSVNQLTDVVHIHHLKGGGRVSSDGLKSKANPDNNV